MKTKNLIDRSWLGTLQSYLFFIFAGNLTWEIFQLPLYNIWTDDTLVEIAFAVIHCTAGDVLIALSCLIAALIMSSANSWPEKRYRHVATLAIIAGIAYTIFSEWLNTVVRESWAYSDLMPVLPPLNTGLSPLLQWIVIPVAGFCWARRINLPASQFSDRDN